MKHINLKTNNNNEVSQIKTEIFSKKHPFSVKIC